MSVRVVAAILFTMLPTNAVLAQDAVIARGKTGFQVCAACHSVKPGEKKLGPSLAGISGRKAGTSKDFMYSAVLAKAGFAWDDARLSDFIAAPTKALPGTKMIFRGIPDASKRQAIIDYLKSLPAK